MTHRRPRPRPAEPCPICGPQPAPYVHAICHPVAGITRNGCGHPLANHALGTMRCRICGLDCGIDCRMEARP